MILYYALAVVIATVIGVDVTKNQQSYRNIGLRIGDASRILWFWPMHLRTVRRYVPRHSLAERMNSTPGFMSSWHLR